MIFRNATRTPYPTSSKIYYSVDGVAKTELIHLDSQGIRALLTKIRDKNTPHGEFAVAADRALHILAEEGLAELRSNRGVEIDTPCGTTQGIDVTKDEDIFVVSILRAGDALMEAIRRISPGVSVGHLLIQRDPTSPTKEPHMLFSNLPTSVTEKQVMVVDPMLATGQSVCLALEHLVAMGVKEENILFLNLVSCPEGLAVLNQRFPKIRIITLAIDERLNEKKYIVPGLGDFGDRYYGTE